MRINNLTNIPISSGVTPQPTDGEFLVKFIDYDGTVIQEGWYDTNDVVAVPASPTHEGLVFDGWSCSANIVNGQITVTNNNVMAGAMYHTASGKVEVDVYVGPKASVSCTAGGEIDWGDGTVDSTSSHIYTTEGLYTIKFAKSGDAGRGGINANLIKVIRLPNTITSIGNNAFNACYSLTSIIIPNTVTSIGSNAFQNCNSLISIIIPNNVTSIGNYAFYYCYSLTSITISNTVTSIGTYVFQNCYSLTNITISNSVTSIGNYAFYYCYSLTSIIIPNNVTSIGSSAFQECYSLTSITIPNTVTSIGTYLFQNCYSLINITIPNTVTSIGTTAFRSCYSLASITIPDNVTSIVNSVFNSCYSLASIIIPNTVTSIGSNTFNNCSNCTIFDFRHHTAVPTLSSTNAFESTTGKIVVPDALYNDWISASNWSSLTSQIMKVSEWEAL